jgi:hypothetical protein
MATILIVDDDTALRSAIATALADLDISRRKRAMATQRCSGYLCIAQKRCCSIYECRGWTGWRCCGASELNLTRRQSPS